MLNHHRGLWGYSRHRRRRRPAHDPEQRPRRPERRGGRRRARRAGRPPARPRRHGGRRRGDRAGSDRRRRRGARRRRREPRARRGRPRRGRRGDRGGARGGRRRAARARRVGRHPRPGARDRLGGGGRGRVRPRDRGGLRRRPPQRRRGRAPSSGSRARAASGSATTSSKRLEAALGAAAAAALAPGRFRCALSSRRLPVRAPLAVQCRHQQTPAQTSHITYTLTHTQRTPPCPLHTPVLTRPPAPGRDPAPARPPRAPRRPLDRASPGDRHDRTPMPLAASRRCVGPAAPAPRSPSCSRWRSRRAGSCLLSPCAISLLSLFFPLRATSASGLASCPRRRLSSRSGGAGPRPERVASARPAPRRRRPVAARSAGSSCTSPIDDATRLAYVVALFDEKVTAGAFLRRALGFSPLTASPSCAVITVYGCCLPLIVPAVVAALSPQALRTPLPAPDQRQGRALHPLLARPLFLPASTSSPRTPRRAPPLSLPTLPSFPPASST